MSPSVTVRLLATQSDARLVELARQGHERAFEALVLRYRRSLLGYCRRVLLPEARAEDALQQALLQAWLALQRGDEVRDARAWLYRIVHNTALNALRSSGYDYAELSAALSGADAPHDDLDRRIAVREALAGLAALPEQQREALLRTAVEGASHADAAAEMGVSEGALRGLVYRARASLRTAVTAVTPLPFATWAAGAAEHGGGAVAELAAGGGTAGVVGLLAKGGAVALTAGVLAAGVGTVEQHRQRHAHGGGVPPSPRAASTVDAAATAGFVVAKPVAVVQSPDPSGSTAPQHADRHRHHRRAATPVVLRERAPEMSVHTGERGRAEDGGGEPPRHDMSSPAHDGQGDGGPGRGGRHGGDRQPGLGPGDDGNSGPGRADGGNSGPGSGDDRSPIAPSGGGGHDGSGSGGGEHSGSSGSGGDGGSSSGSGGDSGSSGGESRGSDGSHDSGDAGSGG